MAFTQQQFAQAANDWDLEKLYADLASAKQQVASHKKKGLTEVEKLHLRGLLCGYRPGEIAARLVKTAKGVEVDLCNTLYRYVETLTGRSTNTVENWRDIVDWLQAAGYKTQVSNLAEQKKVVDWGEAPDVSVFYGRTEELATLKQWIVNNRCRLVALLGMGGIGKTALTVRLAEQLQDEFEYIIWRSLRHAPPLADVLAELIQFLSNQETDLPEHVDGVSCLINYLRQHRCLLVLDNLEVILRPGDFAGHYREGYKGYGEFLKRLGEAHHQSCLVLTSREKPREMVLLEGETLPVRSQKLEGLGEAAREILNDKGLPEDDKWEVLIKVYRGNPFALKLVSQVIKEVFDGSVANFLKHMTLLTSDVSALIEQQFNRLSALEQKIMYQLAIEKEPVLPQKLQDMSQVSPQELIETLASLGWRSLIEKSAAGFTLQPAVMEYVTNRMGLDGEEY